LSGLTFCEFISLVLRPTQRQKLQWNLHIHLASALVAGAPVDFDLVFGGILQACGSEVVREFGVYVDNTFQILPVLLRKCDSLDVFLPFFSPAYHHFHHSNCQLFPRLLSVSRTDF
jgi:hypothetical protein